MEHVLLFQNVAITTLYTHFYPVFLEYRQFERCTRSELAERLGMSPSQVTRTCHDGVLMKLWDTKMQLLALGRQWKQEIEQQGHPSAESLRQAAMNVPLFALTWQAIPGESSDQKILTQFRLLVGSAPRTQDLQSAARRYQEAFFHSPPRLTVEKTARLAAAPMPGGEHEERSVRLPRAAQLLAKYLQLVREFSPDEVAACQVYVKQVKEE